MTVEGRLLGERYRLAERIDAGGAGVIWRAQDERLGREVAVKIVGAQADEAFRTRFGEEARRAASVSHPNVITVYDEGLDGDDAFMVMEYVRGRTLREIVAERGALAPREAGRIITQLAAALDAAHAAGVIHCDVKPANVIVDDGGTIKLTDFGVAMAVRDVDRGELVGTARYVAPERIEGAPVSERTDVYGLGLLAFELLAGRPAFEGTENEDLLRARLEATPPSLGMARPELPEGADGVVARALARDPGRRYASAGAFARTLVDALDGGDATVLLRAPAAKPLPAARRRKGGRAITNLVAALALVAAVAIVAVLVASFANLAGQAAPTPTPAASATGPRIPNVVGQHVNEAASALLAAGLRGPNGAQAIPWTMERGSGPACTVISQEPPADSAFERGAVARLVIVSGDCSGSGSGNGNGNGNGNGRRDD